MRILFLLSIALLFLPAFVSMPLMIVQGKVVLDGTGPAIGVSVSVKETTTATATDEKGNFSVSLTKLPATLVFNYVGYKSVEYKVTEKKCIGRNCSNTLCQSCSDGGGSSCGLWNCQEEKCYRVRVNCPNGIKKL